MKSLILFLQRLVYKILERPSIYALSQKILLPGAARMLKPHYDKIFAGSAGLVLDVGCGPALTTPRPHDLVFGIDINDAYISEFTGGFVDKDLSVLESTNRKTFGFVGSADSLPFDSNFFNETRCMGIFHHMPFTVATKAIQEMVRTTKVGGSVIIIDNVLPKNPLRNLWAWIIRKLDRGRWVRTEEGLKSLVFGASPQSWRNTRFAYTTTGLELMCFTCTKI